MIIIFYDHLKSGYNRFELLKAIKKCSVLMTEATYYIARGCCELKAQRELSIALLQ